MNIQGMNKGDWLLLAAWVFVLAGGAIWQAIDPASFRDLEGLYLWTWLPLGFYSWIRFDRYLKRNQEQGKDGK